MPATLVRYEFDGSIPTEEIEATLVLAVIATEAIHGETAAQLGVAHCFDAAMRTCVIEINSEVGRDFNSLFVGFMRREFGRAAFHSRRINTSVATATAA